MSILAEPATLGRPDHPGGIPEHLIRRAFRGPAGVRAGWRLVAFIMVWLGCYFVLLLAAFALGLPSVGGMWDPARFLPMETINLVSVAVATLVLGCLERRALSAYGLPLRASRAQVGEGVVWGAAAMTSLVGAMWFLGGYTPRGLNMIGGEVLTSLLLWVVGFLMLGVAEELLFRAYPLFTVTRSIGFWPAALVLSVLFSAFHAGKEGENWVDLLSLLLFGMFAAFTVWRTGSVWFAVGFHAAFNFLAWSSMRRPMLVNCCLVVFSWRSSADRSG